jgi:hypothetical protein
MLYLYLAEITQSGAPPAHLAEHFGHGLRKQDMPGITAIHYPLGQVNSITRNIAVSGGKLAHRSLRTQP